MIACWIVSKYLTLSSAPSSVDFSVIDIAVGSVDSTSAKVVSSPASGASVVSAAGVSCTAGVSSVVCSDGAAS